MTGYIFCQILLNAINVPRLCSGLFEDVARVHVVFVDERVGVKYLTQEMHCKVFESFAGCNDCADLKGWRMSRFCSVFIEKEQHVMRKSFLAVLLASFSLSGTVMAQSTDPLHIVGHYKCTGYDSYDGAFKGDLTFTLDESASQFDQSFGAYQFKLVVDLHGTPTIYSGFAAAQGQALAMYFANDSQDAPTDRGVGMASITRDQDINGNYTTTLHKSYYLPEYMRAPKEGRAAGGRGTEVCVKTASR